MDLSVKKSIISRLNEYILPSAIEKKRYLYKENLISGDVEVYAVSDFKEAKPSVNNVHSLTGRNITSLVTDQWHASGFDNSTNRFMAERFFQNVAKVQETCIDFHPDIKFEIIY